MLKVKCELWNQSRENLRQEALMAKHPRTRERLMALYDISEGKSATSVGKQSKRKLHLPHNINLQALPAYSPDFILKDTLRYACRASLAMAKGRRYLSYLL
mgnify:CR=1 FL=1